MRHTVTQAFSDRGPKLLRDLISLLGGQFFSSLIGFASFTYLARALDPPSYGSMEYAIGVTSFFTVIVETGLGPVGVRHLSRDRGRAEELASRIPAARVLLALATIPLVGLSSYVTRQDARTTGLVWLFAISLMGIPWRQDWLLQALDKMSQAAPGPAVRMAAFAAGVFIFVHSPHDLMIVGLVAIASEAIGSAYYIIAQHFWALPFRVEMKIAAVLNLIREGVSLSLTNIVWTFTQFAPLFLVASLIGGAETAWFGAPQRILLALLAFGFLYHFNLYPISARRLVEDRADWNQLMRTSLRVSAWGGIGITLVLTLLSEPFMVLIFGKKFAPSVPVFAVLIWVLPIRLLADHARWALVASALQSYLLVAEISGALALLVAGSILVPLSGAVGAAIAAVAGNLTTWAVAHFLAVRHVGALPSMYVSAIPAITALACGWIGYRLSPGAFVATTIAMGAYVICAQIISGGLKSDIKRLAYAKNTNV
jgi:O-antigen/teichoic acid export membrane protein